MAGFLRSKEEMEIALNSTPVLTEVLMDRPWAGSSTPHREAWIADRLAVLGTV